MSYPHSMICLPICAQGSYSTWTSTFQLCMTYALSAGVMSLALAYFCFCLYISHMSQIPYPLCKDWTIFISIIALSHLPFFCFLCFKYFQLHSS